jgi:hypothetical protein
VQNSELHRPRRPRIPSRSKRLSAATASDYLRMFNNDVRGTSRRFQTYFPELLRDSRRYEPKRPPRVILMTRTGMEMECSESR